MAGNYAVRYFVHELGTFVAVFDNIKCYGCIII